MFVEPITLVPSGFSGYIWLDCVKITGWVARPIDGAEFDGLMDGSELGGLIDDDDMAMEGWKDLRMQMVQLVSQS